MLIFWQIATFFGIVALSVAWGSWVWDSHRTIQAPLTLGEVVVHGVPGTDVDATARALALGVAGTVAEHYRTVDFINEASRTAGEFLILARGAAPEPLLLQSRGEVDRLDVTVEFAGAKVNSKGLAALFRSTRPPRGALSISVSLIKGASDTEWKATASATFPENSAYGFQTEAEGTLDAIARTIGQRFVQAHYSVNDQFFAAIAGGDFTKLWDVRREAAEMALRGIGGDVEDTEALRGEARAEYTRIQHLLKRYRRRDDLQRLGAYLAQVADQLELARGHAHAARESAELEGDRQEMTELLAAIELEIDNRNSQTTAVALAGPETGGTLEQLLEKLRTVNETAIADLKIDEMIARFPAKRAPRIGLVLAVPTELWLPRVEIVGTGSGEPDKVLGEHASRILSLFASIAPEAEFVISPVGGASHAVSVADIGHALSTLAAMDLDAIYLDFGVSARSFGTEDGAQRWKAATEANLERMAGFKGLAILAAGNDDVEVPALRLSRATPAFAVIGSAATQTRAPRFSNYGSGVDFVAPAEVSTFVDNARFAQQRGTSMSAAVFAAAAIRLAAISETPPGGARLKQVIAETAVAEGEAPMPDFAAAGQVLDAAAGN